MRLTVNGAEWELTTPPLASLLHALREELGVTSPKAGCQEGGCGACTVLVDGEPRPLVPAPARGRRGDEGHDASRASASRGRLDGTGRLPRAVRSPMRVLHAGVRARDDRPARAETRSPSREEILEALGGHVCRCTGYVKIVAAVEAAARGDVSDDAVHAGARRRQSRRAGSPRHGESRMKAVGTRLPRYDGVAHVTGRTVFVDDVRVQGTLGEGPALASPPRRDRPARRRARPSGTRASTR